MATGSAFAAGAEVTGWDGDLYRDGGGMWEGALVEIHDFEGPFEVMDPDLLDDDRPEIGPEDLNGARGRVVGWSDEDGRYVIETFGGLVVGVPEENLREFSPPPPEEEAGFDVAWPSGPIQPEDFGSEATEALQRKGWCLIQMFVPAASRRETVIEALDLVDWRLPERELEVQYLGHDNCTKFADLDPDDISQDPEGSLAQTDRALTQLGLLLAPTTPDALGFVLWGRHAGQVRMPLESSDEEFLRPSPLSEDDYDPGGKVYRHLNFIERRKLLALYMIENDGGDLWLYPVSSDPGADKQGVRVPVCPGKVLLLQPDTMTYSYQPRAGRSLLLQTWYMGEPSFPDPTDNAVAELPASQRCERVHINTMQFRIGGSSNSPEEAWNMWISGTDCALTVPSMRFDVDQYYSADGNGLLYTNHFAGMSDEVAMQFDYTFFGISFAEADVLGPAQRIQLEVGYQVLYAAGYSKESVRGMRCGVFVGDAGTDWKVCGAMPAMMSTARMGGEINPGLYSGWQLGMGCSRLSHILDMKGPCVCVDTACSSSLVAMGQASRTLVRPREGQISPSAGTGITKSLVMGVCLDDGPATFMAYCAATMLSASGRSFTFDESANGFMRGEGIGGAFLRLSDEDMDAQQMMGCVVGSNVNQDGRSASMTAPHGPSQQACIRACMAEAGLKPSEITIAECHGTGTALGDPIEVGALRDVMKDRGNDGIVMTSGKSNFGHMEANAGIGGILRCLCMLNAMTGASNLHLRSINPHIEFVGYPALFVSEHADCGVRSGISGVSSFGVGGTNARADMWARSKLGYLSTAEVNTYAKIRLKSAAFERVALNGQPGPGVTDRVYITGTWDAWSSTLEMDPIGEGEYVVTIPLGDTRCEKFRIILNEDPRQSIYPAVDLSEPFGDILGPDWEADGRGWMLDGRDDGGRTGDSYRIKFTWGFSWNTGEYKRVSWERQVEPQALQLQRRPYLHQYAVAGTWTSWKLSAMTLVDEMEGVFQCTARIGVMGQEEFHFVRDRDLGQVIYPDVPHAMKQSILVRGPDAHGEGRHWQIRGPIGETVTIRLRVVDAEIEVTAVSPTKGRRTWRSEEIDGLPRALLQ
mmetsp:Transcript_137331/g.342442  ORF Transcript_137331/g.342442 Transcript_137331/m.342442 type:complete len:1095 (+) Transcript_137331:130-3414(+)